MRGTWSTGLKPFGVPLLVHWSFLLWPLVLGPLGLAKGFGVLATLMVSLLIHEYSHVLAARSVGLAANDVTVYIFGGAASFPSLLDMRPRHEAYVVAMGPLSSFVLSFLAYMASLPMNHPLPWIMQYAIMINIVLGVFNILPLFPMDGGRLLRAALTPRFGQIKATNAATWTTTVLGGMLGLAALAYGGWNISAIMLVMILMAWNERNALVQHRLMEAMKRKLRENGFDVE